MNNYLLLEIGVEELPSRFGQTTLDQIENNLSKLLKEERVNFDNIDKYATPRRLTFVIKNLADKASDLEEEVKGPAKKIAVDEEGNFTKPALGFMKSKGLDPENVYFKQVGNAEYLFGTIKQSGKETAEILKNIKGVYINKYEIEDFMESIEKYITYLTQYVEISYNKA